MPSYIPDGLSDMGSDPEIDPRMRIREKMRVNKMEFYKEAELYLLELIKNLAGGGLEVENPEHSERLKQYIVRYIGTVVYNHIQYDHKEEGNYLNPFRSVPIAEIHKRRLGKCRHHAMFGQVLMQFMGITSRLLKCDTDLGKISGPHVSNLVRINYKNYLLDITNPDFDPDKKSREVFLRPIPEKDVGNIQDGTVWNFTLKGDRKRVYQKRSNMFYRIRRD